MASRGIAAGQLYGSIYGRSAVGNRHRLTRLATTRRSRQSRPTEFGGTTREQLADHKWHLPVDMLGLTCGPAVFPTHVQVCDATKPLLKSVRKRLTRLQVIRKDGASRSIVEWGHMTCYWVLAAVLRPANATSSVVLPKRWIAERTLACLGRYRGLNESYEANPRNSETWTYFPMDHRMAGVLLAECRSIGRLPGTSLSEVFVRGRCSGTNLPLTSCTTACTASCI